MAFNPLAAGTTLADAQKHANSAPVKKARKKIQATNKKKAAASKALLAKARNPANSAQAQIQNIAAADVPSLSDYFNSTDYVNPYYVGQGPVDAQGNKVYSRFDYEQPGAGIQYDENPALAFDRMFGSQYIPRLEAGEGNISGLLSEYGLQSGGLGGAGVNNIVGDSVSPELQKVLDFNAGLDKYDNPKYTYAGLDDFYRDAFDAYGLDANSIGSLDALRGIDPSVKAGIINHVASSKQAQNQLPPQGILDSIPGKIALGLAGAISPLGGLGLGAFAGGLSGEGGPLGALSGALQGYGYGNILNNGIPNPFGGPNVLDPVVFNGSGGIPPLGNGPAWVLDHANTPPTFPGGIPDFQFPGLPPGTGTAIDIINDTPPNSNNPPPLINIPPANNPGVPQIPGGVNDAPVDDQPTIPPITTPPIQTGSPNIPDIPSSPGSYDVMNQGMLNIGGNYLSPSYGGPARQMNYFGYESNPFL